MKQKLLSLALLLLFASGATAQLDNGESEKAKAYIKQAKEYASEEEFSLAVEYFQKAYDTNSDIMSCEEITFLGMSYYMLENNPLAIKFLELAVACERDKEALSDIYTHLGYSYEEIGEFDKAIECIEKAISHSSDNKEISIIYEQLANIYFENEQDEKTIESIKKSIDHYLEHLSVTEGDVMKGSVKSDELGKKYFSLTWFASSLNLHSEMVDAVIKSALTGNKDAIGFCKENDISYRSAIVLPESSSKEDKEAKILIEQANLYASKEDYAATISTLEKAYSISPAMFDGNSFYLLGLSYYTIEDYLLGIEYLERALNYSLDKEGLYNVHSTLGDAYFKVEDYRNAEINAERALYLTRNNKDILDCSLRLASIYYAQENYNGTIESFENAIRYYKRIHSISDVEVMKGNVTDKFLAEIHFKLSSLLYDAMRGDESNAHLQKAALYGSEPAIEMFEENGVEYKE